MVSLCSIMTRVPIQNYLFTHFFTPQFSMISGSKDRYYSKARFPSYYKGTALNLVNITTDNKL